MELALIGINHRTAGIELRERTAFRVEQACEAADQLRARGILREVVILSTCNRTELYGVARDPSDDNLKAMEMFLASYHQIGPAELSAAIYRHRNREVVRHIYCVAAGLDSLLLGESEIVGQVRAAYRVAMDHGVTGRVLNRLFQSALEVGKRVRNETQLGSRPTSVAFAGVKQAEALLPGLENQRVMVVGAGATSELVVKHLCDRGVPQFRILNRTMENAKALASRYGGEVLPWEKLPEVLDWPDLIVTSVTSPEPILTREHLEAATVARGKRSLMIMDLGVPRNVDSRAKTLPHIHLSDIDDLTEVVEQNKKAREEEIPRAMGLIDDQIDDFMRWQGGVAACAVFAELHTAPEHKREALLRKHLAGMPHLTEPARTHFTALLEKFLKGTGNDQVEYSYSGSETSVQTIGNKAVREL
jgi:glutamyl-tRNA reductase